MPIHIEASPEDVAQVVLLPGDPGRAEYIANNFLKDVRLYTEYRKMYGYTGYYRDRKISVQTTGMGSPSVSIIAEELNMLGVKSMIRIGTCGALSERLELGDLVVATGAHSTHDILSRRFDGACFSGVGDFMLNVKLMDTAVKNRLHCHAGTVLTSETFYEESFDLYDKFAEYGTLAVEMETYLLYALCSKFSIKASSVLTVSDLVKKSIRAPKELIKTGVDNMVKTVLDAVCDSYDYLIGKN